jgi:hypothetical protein
MLLGPDVKIVPWSVRSVGRCGREQGPKRRAVTTSAMLMLVQETVGEPVVAAGMFRSGVVHQPDSRLPRGSGAELAVSVAGWADRIFRGHNRRRQSCFPRSALVVLTQLDLYAFEFRFGSRLKLRRFAGPWARSAVRGSIEGMRPGQVALRLPGVQEPIELEALDDSSEGRDVIALLTASSASSPDDGGGGTS